MGFIWKWLLIYYKMIHQVCSVSGHLVYLPFSYFLSKPQRQTFPSSVMEIVFLSPNSLGGTGKARLGGGGSGKRAFHLSQGIPLSVWP